MFVGDSTDSAGFDEAEKAVMRFPDKAENTARMLRLMIPRAPPSPVCIFAEGNCITAARAISNLADEIGSRPVVTVTDGRIPGWVGAGTCAVCMSDSPDGIDRSMIEELKARGCDTSILRAGKEKGGWNTVLMPPMCAMDVVAFSLGYLCTLLTNRGIADAMSALSEAASFARVSFERIRVAASEAAGSLRSCVVASYSASAISACSAHMSRSIVRRTGGLAFCGELPEYDHNELVGWSDPNPHAPDLRMVVIEGGPDCGLVPIIISCMEEVLRENGRDVTTVSAGRGPSLTGNMAGIMLAELIAAGMEDP